MHLQISVHIWSSSIPLGRHEWEHTIHVLHLTFSPLTVHLAEDTAAPHKNILFPVRVCLATSAVDEHLVSNSLLQMMLHLTVSVHASHLIGSAA